MNFKRMAATMTAALALASGGALVNAAPAAAATACPSAKLCLYKGGDFTYLNWTSTSTKACLSVEGYYIGSYVNRLPVTAVVWEWKRGEIVVGDPSFLILGTIRSGGSSSDTLGRWNRATFVCTGGEKPWERY
ncbi:proteinase inhibitor I36 SMPI [Streptomyces sp. NPDC014870]|uniref:proteinase inhibitor I36 SMPI n=1 Tax=Streptomyces sp. NPDC014870 TaxID=3364925 RepID=UPI0036FC4A4F